MVGYGIVFLVAALTTYLATFPVRRLAIRFGAIVVPDERRVHARPTPTVGGAAMFVALLAALGVASVMPQFRQVFHGSTEPLGVALAATIIFVVHVVDDRRGLSPPAKIAGQVLAGTALSTDDGDLVLDPFCGSGTTGAVAVALGRRFVGVELNPEYVAIAARRLSSTPVPPPRPAPSPSPQEAPGTRAR